MTLNRSIITYTVSDKHRIARLNIPVPQPAKGSVEDTGVGLVILRIFIAIYPFKVSSQIHLIKILLYQKLAT